MELAPIFQDGIVFQAGKPIRLFGTGEGLVRAWLTEKGTVLSQAEAYLSGDKWLLELPACPYGGPYELTINLNGKKCVLSHVMIGEVLLLGGQSNMKLFLDMTVFPDDLPAEDYPPGIPVGCSQKTFLEKAAPLMQQICLYSADSPEEVPFTSRDGWVTLTPQNAGKFPSLGYIVSLYLRRKISVPLGLIGCSQGAAAIQSYLPDREFAGGTLEVPYEQRSDRDYPWNAGHSLLYHMQVEPLLPYSLRAVLWYQGESNQSDAESVLYETFLTRLIEDWRQDFQEADLPFVIVQLADTLERISQAPGWRTIQDVQWRIQSKIPHVQTVKCSDCSEKTGIHPMKKAVLGGRLARAVEELLPERDRSRKFLPQGDSVC